MSGLFVCSKAVQNYTIRNLLDRFNMLRFRLLSLSLSQFISLSIYVIAKHTTKQTHKISICMRSITASKLLLYYVQRLVTLGSSCTDRKYLVLFAYPKLWKLIVGNMCVQSLKLKEKTNRKKKRMKRKNKNKKRTVQNHSKYLDLEVEKRGRPCLYMHENVRVREQNVKD